MATGGPLALVGARILVAEDDYLLANSLVSFLAELGAIPVGPAPTVEKAMALVLREQRQLDAAVLDVNLHNEHVYVVADKLVELGIPIVFTTGYDALLMDSAYVGLPRCSKPIDTILLAKTLDDALRLGRPG